MRFDSILKKSTFESIPNVGIVGSGRFQKLEPKLDPTISLIKLINNLIIKRKVNIKVLYKLR